MLRQGNNTYRSSGWEDSCFWNAGCFIAVVAICNCCWIRDFCTSSRACFVPLWIRSPEDRLRHNKVYFETYSAWIKARFWLWLCRNDQDLQWAYTTAWTNIFVSFWGELYTTTKRLHSITSAAYIETLISQYAVRSVFANIGSVLAIGGWRSRLHLNVPRDKKHETTFMAKELQRWNLWRVY